MKKSIRLTSAAMAALIAMSCASFSAIADAPSAEITEGIGYTDEILGGWQVNSDSTAMNKNKAAKAAFKKATEGLTGVSYKAVAFLGSQVVAGKNYAVLCRATPANPDASPEVVIMYIYEDLSGNAEITGFQTIIGEQLDGGFGTNTGRFAISDSKNKKVYSAYKKAMKDLVGVSYKPVLYLGAQVVAGSNYMVLCRSQVVYPNAPYQWSLVTVNKDPNGKVQLLDIQTLNLGNIDKPEDIGNAQIANPWREFNTVSEAEKAAAISFSAPEKLGDYQRALILATDKIVEVRYTNGDNEICIRKAAGSDDVSGDFNTYKNISEKKLNGKTVTLKGNDGVKSAVWTDAENSYSIYSENELSADFVESIIAKIS